MTAKKLTFALFGAGRIGKIHGGNVAARKDCQLKYIIDPFADNANDIVNQHGAQHVDTATALADDSVDAVIIASATDTHADLIEQSARAGKAIFCEKPIDLDINRVSECLAVVEQEKAVLAVGFNRRFDPDFSQLRDSLINGAIGNAEQIIITSRDPAPPPVEYIKVSGGLFRDMMIHDFDMALWLLEAVGDTPASIMAYGNVQVNPEIGEAGDIDTAMVMIQSHHNRQVHINNSRRAAYGYDQRVEIHGSNGMLQLRNRLLNQVTYAGGYGYTQSVAQPFFLERYASAYKIELDEFVHAIQNNTPVKAGGEDGRRSLVLANAALASMQSRQNMAVNF